MITACRDCIFAAEVHMGERLFRKQHVVGSIPTSGSTLLPCIVKAATLALNQLVQVRILVGQPLMNIPTNVPFETLPSSNDGDNLSTRISTLDETYQYFKERFQTLSSVMTEQVPTAPSGKG